MWGWSRGWSRQAHIRRPEPGAVRKRHLARDCFHHPLTPGQDDAYDDDGSVRGSDQRAQRPDRAGSTRGVERPQVDLEACDPVALLFLSRGFLNAFW